MALQTTILFAVLLLPAYYFSLIYRNYIRARATGLPIVFLPVSPASPIWLLTSGPLHKFFSRIGLGHLTRLTYFGWDVHEKAQPFLELRSNAFVMVTPWVNWVYLADPSAVQQLYAGERRGDFTRPPEGVKMLDVFGPNITTAQGADWQRMRRITAASFSETTMRVVWVETLKQGRAMIKYWLASGEKGVTSTADDTRTLALNVLLRAGFGKAYDFEGQDKSAKVGKESGPMDYREAIKLVLENAVLIIGIGPDTLPKLGAYIGKLAVVGTAVKTFKKYLNEVLNEGKQGFDPASKGNLLASLVRASQEENQLTEEEVFGNMFVYTFGGHDTTAHSFAFTFVLLSVYPEVQKWMREELREALKGDQPDEWSYEDFGKLKRTLAVQLETIRLYNPVLGIVKGPLGNQAQQLTLDDGNRTISLENTALTIVINAIHAHPQYWGEDANEWRPSRWIYTDNDGAEQIFVPEKGVFQAWSDGIRVCPGKKFGQVEHVALMASVLRDHTVEAAKEKGETTQQTQKRIMDVVKDRGMVLNVQMFHPEKARLLWSRCA